MTGRGLRHPEGATRESILALLGYLNTRVCDWWVRRFVDRHVTAPILNNLPLPGWSPDEVRAIAANTAAILALNGYSALAGGMSVGPLPASSKRAIDFEAATEVYAARGFGLDTEDLTVVFEDFNERGATAEYRARVLDLWEGRGEQ